MAFCSSHARPIIAVRFGPNPGTSTSRPGCLLDHPQRVHPEVPDDPAGGPRPDPLDQPRAEVPFDALDRGRQHRGERVDLELPPILGVRPPPADQPQALPRLHPQQRTHHRQQIRTGAVGGHPGDRVAGLLVGVGDPLQHRIQHRPARPTPLPRPGPATRWSPAHRASRHARDQRPPTTGHRGVHPAMATLSNADSRLRETASGVACIDTTRPIPGKVADHAACSPAATRTGPGCPQLGRRA